MRAAKKASLVSHPSHAAADAVDKLTWYDGARIFATANLADMQKADPFQVLGLLVDNRDQTQAERAAIVCALIKAATGIEFDDAAIMARVRAIHDRLGPEPAGELFGKKGKAN